MLSILQNNSKPAKQRNQKGTEDWGISSIRWNNICDNNLNDSPSESKFWQKIKNIENGNTHKTEILPDVKDSDQVKANNFAEQFKATYTDPTNLESTDYHIYQMTNEKLHYEDLSYEELRSTLKTLRKKASSGLDGVSNLMLCNLNEKNQKTLLKILNLSLQIGQLPTIWKSAKIVLIAKRGQNKNSNDGYRPISLTSCIAKLMERILKNRLVDWCNENNIISAFQSGFRRNRSTNDKILRIIHDIKLGFNKKEKTGLVTFDIKKAFDKVSHKKLVKNLTKINCPAYLLNWIKSFLEAWNFTIQVNESNSFYVDIECGVPQAPIDNASL